ncbi:MAG: sigma-70 family RNA polymerase sigma factor, partial [Candidatus Eremiobacteraeota bacterium]|nr:sigma-70 family RNA polymerase sigma factor [Candidatus Eremiobacteraeota bacterium]
MLYARHHALVYGTALRVLHDPSEAEDIVQNIFLRIYSRPGRFRGENVAGWLTTLARNAAIDRFRRLRLERLHGERIEFTAPESVEDATLRRMEDRRVREALEDLSDEQRVLLIAIYFGGY